MNQTNVHDALFPLTGNGAGLRIDNGSCQSQNCLCYMSKCLHAAYKQLSSWRNILEEAVFNNLSVMKNGASTDANHVCLSFVNL